MTKSEAFASDFVDSLTPPIRVVLCGLYWTRTSDPIDVNDVLYQLSQQTIGTGIIIQSRSIFVKDSFTVLEPDLAALRLLGQVHNSRIASLLRHCSFVHHASASLYPALRALSSAPHDVNNVLCQLSQDIQLKFTVRTRWSL